MWSHTLEFDTKIYLWLPYYTGWVLFRIFINKFSQYQSRQKSPHACPNHEIGIELMLATPLYYQQIFLILMPKRVDKEVRIKVDIAETCLFSLKVNMVFFLKTVISCWFFIWLLRLPVPSAAYRHLLTCPFYTECQYVALLNDSNCI